MIEQVASIVGNSPKSAYNSGVFAHFQKIDAKWGMKFYKYRDMRDKTYDLQSLAYQHGLAPQLGELFEATTPDGDVVYGYITECIQEIAKCVPDYWRKIDRLTTALSNIMIVRDIHDENCGVLANGDFVCIDFSHCGDDLLHRELDWNSEVWS